MSWARGRLPARGILMATVRSSSVSRAFIDAAEGTGAQLFDELKLAEPFGRFVGQPAGRGFGIKLDAGATGGADDGFGPRIAGRQ